MKTTKLILAISLCFVFFNGCSKGESLDEITEEQLALEKIEISFDIDSDKSTSSSNRTISNQIGDGNPLYYRISYTNTTTSFERFMIGQNFKASTIYVGRVYDTSDELIQIWSFFPDDANAVDSFINQNSLTILEHETSPTIIQVTYDNSVTETIKDDIKSEFEIISVFNTNGQSETWAFKDCCISPEPCNKFADPAYNFFGLITEQVIQH